MRKSIIKLLITYAILAAVIIVLFEYIFMLNLIPSESMEGTIMTGDVVVATRYDRKEIERYDIMVFIPPEDESSYFIKRVIGLPGETIEIRDGKVFADGVELEDFFLPEEMSRSGSGTYQVPNDSYFMLGDNRNHSRDSRFWKEKYVPLENMVAKARFVAFPFRNFGSIT